MYYSIHLSNVLFNYLHNFRMLFLKFKFKYCPISSLGVKCYSDSHFWQGDSGSPRPTDWLVLLSLPQRILLHAPRCPLPTNNLTLLSLPIWNSLPHYLLRQPLLLFQQSAQKLILCIIAPIILYYMCILVCQAFSTTLNDLALLLFANSACWHISDSWKSLSEWIYCWCSDHTVTLILQIANRYLKLQWYHSLLSHNYFS